MPQRVMDWAESTRKQSFASVFLNVLPRTRQYASVTDTHIRVGTGDEKWSLNVEMKWEKE